jgi:hypothetical protein
MISSMAASGPRGWIDSRKGVSNSNRKRYIAKQPVCRLETRLLSDGSVHDAGGMARFEREAQLLASPWQPWLQPES